MELRITIDLRNDAFAFDGNHVELNRVLTQVAEKVAEKSDDSGPIIDINGNTCGSWRLVD